MTNADRIRAMSDEELALLIGCPVDMECEKENIGEPCCFDCTLNWLKKEEKQCGPDYVKVVRCKDCRWWTKQENTLQGRCALNGSYPTGSWFCANGERGSEDADSD